LQACLLQLGNGAKLISAAGTMRAITRAISLTQPCLPEYTPKRQYSRRLPIPPVNRTNLLVTTCSHQTIDARLLRLVEASVEKIDADPALIRRLTENVSRWSNLRLRAQWQNRLQQPWPELRALLLADTDEGAALRQDAPLGGILPPAERVQIMRSFSHDARPA